MKKLLAVLISAMMLANIGFTAFADDEAVVTNSFHGAAFSLIFKKEFYAEASNAEKSARIIDLLALFDLSDRLLPNEKIRKTDDRCSLHRFR